MDNCEKYMNVYKIKNIDGVLLDFDGTIVPSESVFLNTWKEIFKNEFQCVFTDEEYMEYELKRDAKLLDYLIKNHRINPKIKKSVLMQAVYDKYVIEFAKMLNDFDFTPVLEHIKEWNDAGIKLSIVSTSKRIYIEMFFKRYNNYRGMFSCVFCREDVKLLKPNPMIYLLAAKYLGLECSRCLVVEDSEKGIEGAIAAQMKVVKVLENSLTLSGNFQVANTPVLKSIRNIIL